MEILNRKARHNYTIIDTYEAGIKLQGTEVKSIKHGHMQIAEAFVQIKNGKVYLVNSHVNEWSHGNLWNHDPLRTRELLLHKKEIKDLTNDTVLKGYTIVPLKVYVAKGLVKVQVGLAKGKKTYDKRHDLKKKDQERQLAIALKGRY